VKSGGGPEPDREYEKLVKTTEEFHQELFGMLCRIMIHDSLKHIGILDFLKLKLGGEQRSAMKRREKATALNPPSVRNLTLARC
jgi:hypothetical protein